MNNTPLVIILFLVAAAAAGGWYKYFDERSLGDEQSARAEQLASEREATQRALNEAEAELQSARAEIDEIRSQAKGSRAQADEQMSMVNTELEQTRQALEEARNESAQNRRELEQALQEARNEATQNRRALEQALQEARAEAARTKRDMEQALLEARNQSVHDMEQALQQARAEFDENARQAEQGWESERAAWDAERAAWDQEREETRRNLESLQADVDLQRGRFDAQIKRLTQELAAAQGTERTARGELERLRAVVSKLGENEQLVSQLSEQLRNKDTDLADMEARMVELEQAAADESARFNRLRSELQSELAERNVQLEQLENRQTLIRVGSDILFETGSADLSRDGQRTLNLVVKILREYPNRQINVEGHTDDVPIGPALAKTYPSNWELSAARAARAVRYLQDAGIPAAQLNVVGRGAEQPIAANDDRESRARNRRIEIAVMPQDDYKVVVRE